MSVRIDLHVHSRHSPDSTVNVEEYVQHAARVGLNGLALTDHNSSAGLGELDALAPRYPELLLLRGVEVSTIEGHLLVYGVHEAPPAPRPLVETLDWVRDRGGEAVLAHPFRWTHGVGRRVAESSPVAAVEVTNGHNSPRANLRAALLVARRRLGATGGSDAHQITQLGRAFTEFPDGSESTDALLEAIRRGGTRGGGSGSGLGERVALTTRSAFLRFRRGFRPI